MFYGRWSRLALCPRTPDRADAHPSLSDGGERRLNRGQRSIRPPRPHGIRQLLDLDDLQSIDLFHNPMSLPALNVV
jgi:hypothetical protein